MATGMRKKPKFAAKGVFFPGLNEFLNRKLAEDGFTGVEVRASSMGTEIIFLPSGGIIIRFNGNVPGENEKKWMSKDRAMLKQDNCCHIMR
ncbi:hypothetical protein DH2020_043642 [Rehmannia glutinosa]|uniref:Uncharacterized protein n=1 Tax=Rehmannia glutinosa TaxID=99300 RepID=A0ABR0UJ25_REHGL